MNPANEQAAEPIGETDPGPTQAQVEGDDDNAPMVYRTPKDYRSRALARKPELEAEGKEVVLQSELHTHIPKRGPDESGADYAKRYSDAMNAMIRRGVMILNDQCVADVVPDQFSTGERTFDLGPKSGATKKEYREFNEWFGSEEARDSGYQPVPERFRRFEMEDAEPDA